MNIPNNGLTFRIRMVFGEAVLVKLCGPKQLLKDFSSEVGEMAWCVRALTTLPKDLGSVPSTCATAHNHL